MWVTVIGRAYLNFMSVILAWIEATAISAIAHVPDDAAQTLLAELSHSDWKKRLKALQQLD